MKLYVVIDRVDGILEGIWKNKEHAEEYAAQFNVDNFYDMNVVEYHLREHALEDA